MVFALLAKCNHKVSKNLANIHGLFLLTGKSIFLAYEYNHSAVEGPILV